MQCTNCGRENANNASFCANCGAALQVACPACATPQPPDSSFCSNCGARLDGASTGQERNLDRYIPAELQAKLQSARAGRTMAGERRTVTMLFADIQGSTAAAEQLDPEEWAEIVNGAFERLIKPVYRYEGTLARLMGDAVLAFFGAPIAHEDDPERAVMAGLEMLSAARPYAEEVMATWGIDFDLRVGINTGLVVVGEVGSDLRVEYTALGDAVNVAARMEQTALPGTLQVSGETHRLIDRLFVFEELEPVLAKGKSEPVPAYRVIGVADRPATTRGLLGRDTALVGRDAELTTLHGVVDQVRAGKGQICSVIAEAGVGKSRLTEALKSDLAAEECLSPWQPTEADADQVQWAEARCLSYNTTVPYAPFVDLFTRVFGIGADDDATAARALVTSAVAQAGLPDPTAVVPYLCALLGIEPDPGDIVVIEDLSAPELQRRIFSAVITYIEGCAHSRPSILVVEDLHWADVVSLALLEELIAATDRTMLAVIALMRPYREEAAWGFHETAERDYSHRYTSLKLRPLDGQASKAMVDNLLGNRDLPADLQSAVLSRAEGNPFFVEEILRALLEAGTLVERDGVWTVEGDPDQISLSGGVPGVLTARLDRLDDASKLVAQLASVLGREFDFAELAALVADRDRTESALTDLMRRDLLIEQARIPTRTYAFRHALIQETAYNTILLKSRRSLHAQVAEYLIEHDSEPQEIARHLVESKQGVRAVPYLVDAADAATRAMSLADALRFYDQALSWVTDQTPLSVTQRLHEGMGSAYTLIPDLTKASSSYQKMLALGRDRGEPSVQIAALNRLAFTNAFLGGDYNQATAQLEEARLLAEQFDDANGLAEYHMNSCMIATTRGDLEKAAAHDAETARIGLELGVPMLIVGGLIQRVLSLAHATRYEDGLGALQQAKEAASGVTDPRVLSGIAAAEFFYLAREGKLNEAWERARYGAEVAAQIGSSTASVASLEAGMAADMRGDFENALAFYAKARKLGEEAGQFFNSAAATAAMARIYTQLGSEEALVAEMEATAMEYIARPMGGMMASWVFAQLGWAAIEAGDPEKATDLFGQGLAGSSATKLMETPRLLLGLATVRTGQGDIEGAAELLDEARTFVEDRQMAQYRPAVALASGRLLLASGRPHEAAEVLAQGAATAKEIGAAGDEWQLVAARAGALSQGGAVADGAAEEASAVRLVVALADRMVDEEMRDSFVQTATARVSRLSGVASR